MREPTGRLHGIFSQSICCCVMLKSKSDLLSLMYADDGVLWGQKPEILESWAGAPALPAPSRTKQRRLYSRWGSAGGILPLQAAPLTPPPREKQLSPSENLQCGDISSSVTETTLITAQKSDVNAAFVGGKASPAHLLSWRLEAGGGGGWAVRGRCDTRTQTDHTAHPRKELMIHLDLEEAASSRQWRRENGNADTLKSVFTRLQTASNEGKQPQRVHPGWDGGLWRMLMSAQDTFLLPSISPMSYLIRPGSLQQTN